MYVCTLKSSDSAYHVEMHVHGGQVSNRVQIGQVKWLKSERPNTYQRKQTGFNQYCLSLG